jgi:hypothetical protein
VADEKLYSQWHQFKEKKIVCVWSFTFYQGFSKFNQKAALAHAAEGLASQDFS